MYVIPARFWFYSFAFNEFVFGASRSTLLYSIRSVSICQGLFSYVFKKVFGSRYWSRTITAGVKVPCTAVIRTGHGHAGNCVFAYVKSSVRTRGSYFRPFKPLILAIVFFRPLITSSTSERTLISSFTWRRSLRRFRSVI